MVMDRMMQEWGWHFRTRVCENHAYGTRLVFIIYSVPRLLTKRYSHTEQCRMQCHFNRVPAACHQVDPACQHSTRSQSSTRPLMGWAAECGIMLAGVQTYTRPI
jgi:hypothetical protein